MGIYDGMLHNNNGNGDIAVYEPDTSNGWSNGHQVVAAPNPNDYHLLRTAEGFINLKQVKLIPGFVYHKISIPGRDSSNTEITHESTKLSNNSFIVGDDNWDEYDPIDNTIYESDWTTSLKDDGVGYIYYDTTALYLCITFNDEVVRNYDANIDATNYVSTPSKIKYNIEYTIFIKLNSSNELFYNAEQNPISGFNFYYSFKNSNNVTNGTNININNDVDVDENDTISVEKRGTIVKVIKWIKQLEDEIYGHLVVNRKSTWNHSYKVNFNDILKNYFDEEILEMSGYATVLKYAKGPGYNDSYYSTTFNNTYDTSNAGVISKYELERYNIPYDNLRNEDLNNTPNVKTIIILDNYGVFNEIYQDTQASFDDNKKLINITKFNSNEYNYIGAFTENDIIDDILSEDTIPISKTTHSTEIEHISSALLKYNKMKGKIINNKVFDVSEYYLNNNTSNNRLLRVLNNIGQYYYGYDVHNEPDILYGKYAQFTNIGSGTLICISDDMFHVKNAKILIKK